MFGIFLLFRALSASANKKIPADEVRRRELAAIKWRKKWRKEKWWVRLFVIAIVIMTWIIVVNAIANHASCHTTGTNC